jgi:glycosyltransferase involved in cell wall biosynthesis
MADRKIRVAVIGTAGLPARYGGFETLTDYLTSRLGDKIEFSVFCPSTPDEEKLTSYNGARLIYLPFKANGAASILYDIFAIVISVFAFDRLLILGSGGAVILPLLFPFRQKFVLNFGGFEWAREKWGWMGRTYLKLAESLGVRFSGTVIADNQYFVDYISSEYKTRCLLVEYGGDHCKASDVISDDFAVQYPFIHERYFLSVSRAQEDNNIHLLLHVFARLPQQKIVIVSNWDVSEYGRTLKKKYAGRPNIVLLDAIYDLNTLNAIRTECYVYIHSHSFCGTAPSLVEIMNLGKPVFSFLAQTNLETTERKASYFNTADELEKLVASTSETEVVELGKRMKEIALRRYTWYIIASKYFDALNKGLQKSI